jgi:hypothetical protein
MKFHPGAPQTQPAHPGAFTAERFSSLITLIVPVWITSIAGCFYPPQHKPLTPNRTTVSLDLPYDLAWAAVQTVVARNGYHVVTDNPNNGTIEAQAVGRGFTLDDADCGKLRGIGGKVKEEPDPDSSAIYDFHIEAREPHQSVVRIEATFTAPLHVPLHPLTDLQCVSRGRQEARLLNEIKAEAPKQRRPIEHAAPDILKNPS